MKLNNSPKPVFTHEGAVANKITPLAELKRTLMTCLLWEDSFYEGGDSVAKRIASLVAQCDPQKVLDLAISAKMDMKLRHAPLFVIRELARRKGCGAFVESGLIALIRRADELAEFLAMYWKDKKQPLSAAVKRGLATAFTKFSAYELAKYNRDSVIKLRDVMFLVHPKPVNAEQADTWKKLVDGTLESPDTWEVALSAGKDKKETFERLITEKKLGGMALLRNLRNMVQAQVDRDLITTRLEAGVGMALPFRFIAAAKHAPSFEPSLEVAMFKAIPEDFFLDGKTGLLVDVSGSMDHPVSAKSEITRLDAACGLAMLLRESKKGAVRVATFSNKVVEVPPRRGFALRDAIVQSQPHSGTELKRAVNTLKAQWPEIDRLIVITDEQSQDGNASGWADKNWLINVATYKNGVSYGNNWNRVDGWSERVVDYIRAVESEEQPQ